MNSERSRIDSRSGFLDPSFYNQADDGKFGHCLRQYPESICDVMMASHHETLQDDRVSSKEEKYLSVVPCEVLTNKECVKGRVTPWIDNVEISNVSFVHVDENTQEVSEWRYGYAPIKSEKWVLEWSCFDPQ